MAEPDEYYKSTTLKLYFNEKNPQDCSVDETGAATFLKDKNKANTHGTYVVQVQKDLVALGYLPEKDDKGKDMVDGHYGRASFRAMKKFQRHAARVYRMDSSKAVQDVKPEEAFKGTADGICNPDTAKEIRNWIDKKWVNPVGRFKLKNLSEGGKLREDAANAWEAIVKSVAEKGGTLKGAYGDSMRNLVPPKKKSASMHSFHYAGRAVDIRQDFGGGAGQRYYIEEEPNGGNTFWRLWCKTEKQDGTQGTKFSKGAKKCMYIPKATVYDIPAGYYLDLTAEIAAGNFERIKAHAGWKKNYDDSEWWHFQYTLNKQATFVDELELIGISEEKARKAGWQTDALLDRAPG